MGKAMQKAMLKAIRKGRKGQKGQKGQSELIQYTLTILMGVVVLVSVSLIIFTLYDRAVRADIERSLDQITAQTVDRMLKLYEVGKNSRVQPAANSSVLLAEDELRLPDAVSNRNYEIIVVTGNPIFSNIVNITINNKSVIRTIETSGPKVLARTLSDPEITVERTIPNIEATIQGRGDPVDNKIRYYRYQINNTIYDRIILGSAQILVEFVVIK